MELLPLGPVVWIDTAGLDDEGALGAMRIEKTKAVFERTDVALLVALAREWGAFEEGLLAEFAQRKIPAVVLLNKTDVEAAPAALLTRLRECGVRVLEVSAVNAGRALMRCGRHCWRWHLLIIWRVRRWLGTWWGRMGLRFWWCRSTREC